MTWAERSERHSSLLNTLLRTERRADSRREARDFQFNSSNIDDTLSVLLYLFRQNLAAFLWIISTDSISVTWGGSHTELEYSTIGRTIVLYAALLTSVVERPRASFVT